MHESETRIEAYRAARARVLERIAAACPRAGRDPASVTLVAVSKTVAAEALRDAVAAGLDLLGENRVQEAARQGARGPGRAVAAGRPAPVEQGAPGAGGVRRRSRRSTRSTSAGGSTGSCRRSGPRRRYPVLLQVNVDPGPGQGRLRAGGPGGGHARAAGAAAPRGPRPDDGRPADDRRRARPAARSAACASSAERCRARWPELGPDLSMGMSDDFEIAIEEGATIVRVGRALFGERPHHPHDHDACGPCPRGAVKCGW